MGSGNLELRIDRLESRAEIGELCSAYCIACDDRDVARLRGLFVDDVRIRAKNGSMDAEGVDAAMAMFNTMFGIRGPSFHWTHDRFVWFDDSDPDRATGHVLAHAETSLNGVPSLAALRYEDVYRRANGVWKFAERVLSFLYYLPIRDYAAHFATGDRVAVEGGWRAGDYPESQEPWQAWHAEHRPET